MCQMKKLRAVLIIFFVIDSLHGIIRAMIKTFLFHLKFMN